MPNRKTFAKLKEGVKIPYLLEIQSESYKDFLQMDTPKTKRKNEGLQAVFEEVFPIESNDGKYRLEYLYYTIGKPKYDRLECQKRAVSYAVPLKIKIRLKSPKDTKEQEVYLGDLPLMTENGTFIINGDERVIVSQLHRSPGVSFEETLHLTGKRIYSGRIIPGRGAWMEFEFDANDVLQVFIDRRKKILSTILLRALGYESNEEIMRLFTGVERARPTRKSGMLKYIGRVVVKDVKHPETGEIILENNKVLDEAIIEKIWESGVRSLDLFRDMVQEITNTLERDHTKTKEEALLDIYRKLRPGDPLTTESAKALLDRLFFDKRRYDLTKVGRYILNRKLNMNVPLSKTVLDKETIINVIRYLLDLRNGQGEIDDIDHLGNRRVRTVGELLGEQFRIGLARMERFAKDRMAIYDIDTMMPYHLINSKVLSSVIKDFFGRSQLSQFMDQTNPLAEMTHKRRLSALGPGGLSRERAGFEVRDVHHSHYGRICPIETPEGPNIGLIASLSTYARVNKFGFIETPYRKVDGGRVTNKIDYLTADVEDQYIVAQANAKLDKEGYFIEDRVSCRHKGNFPLIQPSKIDYMDVSPKQLISVAAGLIPFLEHDDANRALMGSNMQRQAVPLLFTESPLVGTGLEKKAAIDSGAVVVAKAGGKITAVQSDEITVNNSIVYKLRKFARSNANTCVNQRPFMNVGDRIKAGDVIADGPATDEGELALGKNVLCAFMPWRGYNFEDAILVSERFLKDDVYTSVHIEEFEIESRETRLGNEEITRDIPNLSEEALKSLGDDGIVRIGAEVGPGDILAGKVAPKSETELSPEEKLLRAIFGEKAGDVRDASLTVPSGVEGIVVDTKVFSRKGQKSKSKEELQKEHKDIQKIRAEYEKQVENVKKERENRLVKLLLDVKLTAPLLSDETGTTLIAEGRRIKKKDISKFEKCDISSVKIESDLDLENEVKRTLSIYNDQIEEVLYEEEHEVDKIKRGDELPAGVLKRVVVYIASKKRLSVGDKMAGRHGNKGVIAKILPEEDMPYMEDGTPVQIVLNPLGVPSRMNVGQILETHLGWAAKVMGFKVTTPVFDGAKESEIKQELEKADLPTDGKVNLFDGLTGDKFDQKVTVGFIYMMKLAHLVDDKIHARSIGPYSLVTQQPLGGKAQFGGQRFGEMEVWALEAYGAAYTLQELLTVKSDDVTGRTKTYESIVKGEHALHPGTPESFNVLVKELQSLCLDIKTEYKDGQAPIAAISKEELKEERKRRKKEKRKKK
ncbi:MAG: DNA-directed RNA polymerase subunit beta [Candidatus Omnitrophica bacterium]|nr:DNA-directed RNA polymerase subunit beta [Candidatus Omnitrophota bacterium]MBU1933594.1 DNA-directed RNA polymerase subunit beta [Candidatus Omnitrophota bacterium]